MLLMREVLCEQVYRHVSTVRDEMTEGYANVSAGAPHFDLAKLHKLLAHPCNELEMRDIKPGDLEPYVHESVLEMGKEALRSYASEVLTKILTDVVPPRVTSHPASDEDRHVDPEACAILINKGVGTTLDIIALFPEGTKLTDFRPQPHTTSPSAPRHVVTMLALLDALISPEPEQD